VTIIWIVLYLGLIGMGLVTLYLTLIGTMAIAIAIASEIASAFPAGLRRVKTSAASGGDPTH
jgi:hypothetical protein